MVEQNLRTSSIFFSLCFIRCSILYEFIQDNTFSKNIICRIAIQLSWKSNLFYCRFIIMEQFKPIFFTYFTKFFSLLNFFLFNLGIDYAIMILSCLSFLLQSSQFLMILFFHIVSYFLILLSHMFYWLRNIF